MTITTRHLTLLPAELIDDPADADAIHKQTMALFDTDLPGEADARRSASNILWRRAHGGVLVSSDVPASVLPDGAEALVRTQEYHSGERVTFVATIDATVRVRGRDFPAEDVDGWFQRKTRGALEDITFQGVRVTAARRRGHSLDQIAVAGTATVTDEQVLDRLLREGVGRSKTFGCGMLSVGPL